jgi:hypothetical protein
VIAFTVMVDNVHIAKLPLWQNQYKYSKVKPTNVTIPVQQLCLIFLQHCEHKKHQPSVVVRQEQPAGQLLLAAAVMQL